jgi:putative inorganic carbon (HCO3(-)) transporter
MKGLVLIYALAVIGSLWALRRPSVGFLVYVLFASLRPTFLWGWAGNMADLSWYVGVAMLIGWVFQGFGTWQFGRARVWVFALCAFAVWSGFSTLQAYDQPTSEASLLNLIKYVLPFLVGVTTLRGEKDARRLLWVIVATQGYVSWEMNLSYYADSYNRVQEQGFGGLDNNCYGVSLVTTLGPALGLCLSSKSWTARGLAAVCFVLILHTVILTYSRGALLGALVLLTTAVMMMPFRARYLAAIVLVGALGFRLAGPQVVQRFETTFAEEQDLDYSARSRVDLWAACLKVAVANPIFGIGPDNWPLVAPQYGFPLGKLAHSAWMQTLAETGFPGLSFLALFYGSIIWRLWPIARGKGLGNNHQIALLASGIVMSCIGYVVSAQFVSLLGLELPYYVAVAGVLLINAPLAATAIPVARVSVPAVINLTGAQKALGAGAR